MVKRRKMLIGLGALAAGSAAGVGTGAFTSMSSGNRGVSVNEAADSESFLTIEPSDGPNGAYATETTDGKLTLNFDKDADTYSVGSYEGEGLNPDAVYTFDNVFHIDNKGTQNIDVWVTKSGLPGVSFYFGGDPSNSLQFADWDGLFNKPESLNPSAGPVKVGVKIDVDNLNVSSLGDLSGNVQVHAGPAGGSSEVRSQ